MFCPISDGLVNFLKSFVLKVVLKVKFGALIRESCALIGETFQVFKRSGGISKRSKKSPKPKRASFASTAPVDIPTATSDSSPPPTTDQGATSLSPPANDRVPAQTEDVTTQGKDNQPPSQEGMEETVSRDGLSLDLKDPGGDTQR